MALGKKGTREMNAQIRLNLDTGATEIFTGDKWVATYVQADIDKLQAEIEKLRSWVEMLVEVPFFDEIDHYRGIPVSILRKAQEK